MERTGILAQKMGKALGLKIEAYEKTIIILFNDFLGGAAHTRLQWVRRS
jgi:hypothetical protein